MADFKCPNCGLVEFVELQAIDVDSQSRAQSSRPVNVFKCANCSTRVTVEANQVPMTSNMPPKPAGHRVMSSVSADQRNTRK